MVSRPLAQLVLEFDGGEEFLSHDGVRAGLVVLISMLVSFVLIRTSTRLMRSPRVPWWPGSVTPGGLHIHHLVFGIVMMLLGGFVLALQLGSPGNEIAAAVFGIGAGLTLDEFALWLHLEDVYWAEEGRRSIDATVIAVGALALLLLGVSPLDLDSEDSGTVAGAVLALAVEVVAIAACFGKDRMAHGFVGIFIAPIAWYGACRIGKPGSAWARRFYGDRNPAKQTKAERRFHSGRRTDRFKEWVRTAIGGSTETEYLEKIGERK
jgi:hypothetical protein